MVSIRFSRLLLGLLLAFATLRRDSFALARTHQEGETTMAKRNRFGAFGVESTSGNQGRSRDAIAMGPTYTWPKGRKTMVMEKIKEEVVKRGASKITGKGSHASEMSYARSGTNMNDEIKKKTFNPKSINHVEMGTIGSSDGPKDQAETQLLKSQLSEASSTHGSLESSSNSEAPVSQEPLDETPETTESKKLHEASMDTLNMLSMDYSHTPRHKPPINNGQPLSGKVTRP